MIALRNTRVTFDPDRDVWLAHRPARVWPVMPAEKAQNLAAPPENLNSDPPSPWTTLVPMLGTLGIVGFAVVSRSVAFLVVAGVLVVLMLTGSIGARMAQTRRERRRRERVRRNYISAVAKARSAAWSAAVRQQDALLGLYPDTAGLLSALQEQGALWERRPGDDDFTSVRLGLGHVRARVPVVCTGLEGNPASSTEADLQQLAQDAVEETQFVPGSPVVVPLRTLSSVALVGAPERTRELAEAWIAGIAATCAPTDVRIMGLVPQSATPEWDWTKWLPHTRDPLAGEGFGRSIRALSADTWRFADAVRGLVELRLEQQRRAAEQGGWTARGGNAAVAAEHVVIVIDDYRPDILARAVPQLDLLMARGSELAVTLVLLTRDASEIPSSCGARVDFLDDGTCRYREAGPEGRIEEGVVPDRVDRDAAEKLARLICPLRLAEADAGADLVDLIRLVELLGYDDADQLQPSIDWLTRADLFASELPPTDVVDPTLEGATPARPRPKPADLLTAPIGLRSDGGALVLDLKEAAFEGMGPHGVLVGATGSGKSELLRSLVLGLAAGHSSELLSMLLVDFKGGATFADLGRLPHTVGLITNLADELSLIDRMRASLAGELDRRQQLLRDAGNVDSIRAYHELAETRPDLPPLPYLVVIVDEFGELLEARPEFLEVFVAIGRLGRSLGIHLLLATQRLEEGRIRGLESHLRYRLCLRTYSAVESSTVLGVPDAHALPPMPGLGYLRVDTGLQRFKAATTSVPHRRSSSDHKTPAVAHAFGIDGTAQGSGAARRRRGPFRRRRTARDAVPELRVLIDRLVEGGAAAGASRAAATSVWLPPLPDQLPLADLLTLESPGVPVGLIDDPARQQQYPLLLDPGDGGVHVACVGAPRTGKTTFLRTAVASLAARATPREVSIYLLDLGGGSLHDLAGLPHVGGVAGRHDPESVERMLREMRAVTDERAAAFRSLGVSSLEQLRRHPGRETVLPGPLAADVYLVIDNAGVLRSEFPELDMALADLAATSLQFGVHLILTAGRWLDMRPALLDAIGNRIELRLNDPVDSLAGRRVAETLPDDRPGRSLLRDGRHVQIAKAVEADALPVMVQDGMQAPRIMPLPARVSTAQVPELAAAAGRTVGDGAGFLLGVSEFRLTPAIRRSRRAGLASAAVRGRRLRPVDAFGSRGTAPARGRARGAAAHRRPRSQPARLRGRDPRGAVRVHRVPRGAPRPITRQRAARPAPTTRSHPP